MGRSAFTGYGPVWQGSPHPADPANLWIDDVTGEVVDAITNARRPETTQERTVRLLAENMED